MGSGQDAGGGAVGPEGAGAGAGADGGRWPVVPSDIKARNSAVTARDGRKLG